ncbi:MAG: alpha/beta fold hydrolase [Myxococcota bacterium]|nr:alpha/beta fold hydrolase [Myxococcota bacterium]
MALRAWCMGLTLLAASCGGEVAPDDAATFADAAAAPDARVVGLPDAAGRRDAGPDRLGPPYPIVLAHGFFGFEDFAGVSFITYFYGVKDDLAERGEPLVFTPAVDPFNDSETRGEQLLAHVERILAETGHAKVNLIGHSQGGLDARYVAAMRPDLVESVTTFATPHRGTPIADVVVGLVEDERARDLADRLVRLIGAALYDAAGEETSVFASLRQLSTPGMDEFNARYPNQEGIAYYSLTGRSDRHDGDPDCDAPDRPRFVYTHDRDLDPIEPLLDIAEQIVDGGSADIVNDGLVRVRDARWGRFLGCVPADHFDEIGHLFGDSPGRGNDWDHQAFYADLVAYLRTQGH